MSNELKKRKEYEHLNMPHNIRRREKNIQTNKRAHQLNWQRKKSVKQYKIVNSEVECFQFFRGHR